MGEEVDLKAAEMVEAAAAAVAAAEHLATVVAGAGRVGRSKVPHWVRPRRKVPTALRRLS